jgi:integrase
MQAIHNPLEKWLGLVAYSHSGSESTKECYRRSFLLFCNFVGTSSEQILLDYARSTDRDFRRKYAELIKAWIGSLETSYAELSIRSMVGAVQSFFIYNDLPLGRVPQSPKVVTFHNRDIELTEVRDVLSISSPRDKAFFCMMTQSGLRPGTLCKLRITHIQPDFRKRAIPCKITVPQDLTKGKYRDYFSFMGEESVKYLDNYLKTRANIDSESYIFVQYGKDEDGKEKQLDPKTISKIFHNSLLKLKRKGVVDFKQQETRKPSALRLHCLRKFFRKMSYQAGDDFVRFWMGHRGRGVTDHYLPQDTEFHRKLYAEKALPFLRLETSTPSETEKTISALREENKALKSQIEDSKSQVESLRSDLRITELGMEKFAKETGEKLRKLESIINEYQKKEIAEQNQEIAEG